MTFTLEPIGFISSPYHEKFAIPRQPNLVSEAIGFIELTEPFNNLECVRGLDGFSHIWLQFIFHETLDQGWKPTVRPPRLGGNERVGVFASRSTFRPNGLGLSVVEYLGAELRSGRVRLKVSGIDLLDKTPVVDIKPYITYADAIPQALNGYAQDKPEPELGVEFSDGALTTLKEIETSDNVYGLQCVKSFIAEVLSQDPRPSYKKNKQDNKEYGVILAGCNVKWRLLENKKTIWVSAIDRTK